MEDALLYLIVAAGIALVAAGAYGAAPALFPRRSAHAGGGHHALGPIFTLGGAFPLLEEDLKRPLATSVPVAEVDSPAPPGPAVEYETAHPEAGLEEPYVIYSMPAFDEALLADLMSEIEMLRLQIEALRTEISAVARQATRPPVRQQASTESRRPARAQTTGLPLPQRRQIVEVRRHKRSA